MRYHYCEVVILRGNQIRLLDILSNTEYLIKGVAEKINCAHSAHT